MSNSDIRQYGAAQGIGYYWVRAEQHVGGVTPSGSRRLVAIDELGNVTDTGAKATDDPAAMSEAEAVLYHLAEGIKQADALLEKRRASMPEPTLPPPVRDLATQRLYDDD